MTEPRKLFPGQPRLSRVQFDRHVQRLLARRGPAGSRLKRSEAVALVVRHIRVVPVRKAV